MAAIQDNQRGNPDGMKSLAKFSQMPVERIAYYPDAGTHIVQEIDFGLLFIMAFWSGPSVEAFRKITEILNRVDPDAKLEFVTIDTDGAQSFNTHPCFIDRMGGWGEIAWIDDGVIQSTSGLGYNPECFEPNTLALLASR